MSCQFIKVYFLNFLQMKAANKVMPSRQDMLSIADPQFQVPGVTEQM